MNVYSSSRQNDKHQTDREELNLDTKVSQDINIPTCIIITCRFSVVILGNFLSWNVSYADKNSESLKVLKDVNVFVFYKET